MINPERIDPSKYCEHSPRRQIDPPPRVASATCFVQCGLHVFSRMPYHSLKLKGIAQPSSDVARTKGDAMATPSWPSREHGNATARQWHGHGIAMILPRQRHHAAMAHGNGTARGCHGHGMTWPLLLRGHCSTAGSRPWHSHGMAAGLGILVDVLMSFWARAWDHHISPQTHVLDQW